MTEQTSRIIRKSNITMTLMTARRPEGEPTINSVKLKVAGSQRYSVLICDVWKKGNALEAYPVATMMLGEVNGIDIETSHAGEILHDRILFPKITINGVFAQYLNRIEKQNKQKEVLVS